MAQGAYLITVYNFKLKTFLYDEYLMKHKEKYFMVLCSMISLIALALQQYVYISNK
jgi:hypothetical protein